MRSSQPRTKWISYHLSSSDSQDSSIGPSSSSARMPSHCRWCSSITPARGAPIPGVLRWFCSGVFQGELELDEFAARIALLLQIIGVGVMGRQIVGILDQGRFECIAERGMASILAV